MLGLFKGACFGLIGFICLGAGTLGAIEPSNTPHQSVEFPLDFNVSLNLGNFSSKHLKYRYHSMGRTRLQIVATTHSLRANTPQNSTLVITSMQGDKEMPLSWVEPSNTLSEATLVYEVSLESSGTYLLAPPKNQEAWTVKCLSGCGRQEITLAKFVDSLTQKETTVLSQKLTQLLNFEEAPVEVNKLKFLQWLKFFTSKNEALLSRFPSLPSLSELNLVRPYLGKAASRKKSTLAKEQPSRYWEEVVQSFEFDSYPKLQSLDSELPAIGYGHFISESVPLKMMAQNIALAAVMTALAEQKGYELSFPSLEQDRLTIKTLDQFLEALWATGHHIELRDERTFANFLSFARGEQYIRWPVWFNTQVNLKDNSQLYLPAPHSQFVWQVTGPTINGRVNFFLGISGVGFFPKFDEERPQWTGFESQHQIFDTSEIEKDIIRKATQFAEIYLRRIRSEAAKYAPDYPSDGYAFTGICNDSSAVIERAFRRETTFFPIFRAPQLFKVPKLNDGLDDVLSLLPRDTVDSHNRFRSSQEELKYRKRVGAMISLPYDPNFVWDKKLFKEVQELLNP